jgi:excisionase family DNA binding protein
MSGQLAYTIPQACEVSGLSRSSLYALLQCGKVRAVKHGKRTLILDAELRRWLNSLPTAQSSLMPQSLNRRKTEADKGSNLEAD